MDVLSSAAPLARLLLAVSDGGRDGALWITQRGRVLRLGLSAGRLCTVEGAELEPLGDILRELDAVDGAHALQSTDRGVPIGVRLTVAGATSWSAVQRALVLQRARAVARLLRFPVTRVQRVHGPPARGVPLDLGEAVWRALRALADELPRDVLRASACEGVPLSLTALGRRRARGELAAALQADGTQLAERALLCALGLARPRARREESYALLLRKHRELARNVSAHALLDMPRGADASGAPRALRKLACKLHPDRFQAEDLRLYALSHEVMGALTRAASSLTTARA